MNTTVVALGAIVAVAAAIRSTWSPCGLSMLSSITPLAERSRGHRYGVTASWFVAGSVLGGATLGLLAAGLAAAVRAAGVGETGTCVAATFAATACALSDLRPFGLHLPFHGRQVNEVWLSRYRPWVYASGFGWQIGTGLATYILTAATYLLVVLAALTANPGAAMGLAVLFGAVRGLAVLLSARITTPVRLHAFHRRFDLIGPWARGAVIGVQFAVAAIAATAAWSPLAAIAILIIGLGALAATRVREPAPVPVVTADMP